MKKIALVLLILSLGACKTRPIQPTYSFLTLPSVGSVETVGIGERLLSQGDASTVAGIVLPKDVAFGNITVKRGKYPLVGENAEYRHFQDKAFVKGAQVTHLYLFKKDDSTKTLCVSRSLCTDAEFSIGEVTTYSSSRTQQTLLYNGKIGNRVTLGYREFINDIARPAFSNDVDYDLSESNVLGYKGARLEVIKATNTEITYKVVAGFN